MRTVISEENEKLLQSVDSRGSAELRKAVAEHLYSFRGISISPENIIIGAGTEYLTSLIMLLLGHDKCYAVENPGYKRTYRLFKRSTGWTAAIPQDLSGISVKQLRQTGADVVHTTPSHNFPLGSAMPISRRKEFLDWTYEKMTAILLRTNMTANFVLPEVLSPPSFHLIPTDVLYISIHLPKRLRHQCE